MKILLTGGHLTPALALIPELQKNGFDIHFAGRMFAMENDTTLSEEYKQITKLKIPFYKISTGRLQRRITPYTIKSLLKIPIGVLGSFKIISTVKPDCILSFGGYIALPISIVAKIKGIPIVVHEQTVTSGLANKIISKISDLVIVSHKESLKFFPYGKTILIGNPLREGIFKNRPNLSPKKLPTIYITGGNQGSHAINQAVFMNLTALLEKYFIIHQTGSGKNLEDFNLLHDIKNKLSKTFQDRYLLYSYISSEEIGSILNSADIIISRSGANTVSEVLALRKPAILVPLPKSSGNEQYKNAQKLQNLGVAKILDQKELNLKLLITIEDVLKNIGSYKNNFNQTERYDRSTPQKIVFKIIDLLNDKKKTNSSYKN